VSAHHRTKEWAKVTRIMRPIIQASLPAPCIGCGRLVYPDQPFDVGHIISVDDGGTDDPSNLGPHHRGENRRDGQRISTRNNNRRKVRQQKVKRPRW